VRLRQGALFGSLPRAGSLRDLTGYACDWYNKCNRAELHGQMGEEKERLTGGSRRRDWVGASARLSTAGKRTSRGGRCPKHAQDSTTLEAAAS